LRREEREFLSCCANGVFDSNPYRRPDPSQDDSLAA